MRTTMHHHHAPRCPTGLQGLDAILHGGVPKGRTTLCVGSAGSGKTILACEFAWRSIVEQQEPVVYVTFEESKERILTNVEGLGWDLRVLENEGTLAFVELVPAMMVADQMFDDFDLSVVVERIKYQIEKIGATRVVVDSLSALFGQYGDSPQVRKMMLTMSESLNALGVTTILTAERLEEYGSVSRFRVEEFVSDCVLVLRHVLEAERIRRTVQVLKFRGSPHKQGEFPFTISHQGIVVMPLATMQLDQKSSEVRISSGVDRLDTMLGGGYFQDSVVLVSGPTGTGKTLLSTKFVEACCASGQKALLFAFEESRDQLFRNGASWGIDLASYEAQGLLKVVCCYPESMGAEDHALNMQADIEAFEPARIVVDSLSAMERVVSDRSFREFVITLTGYIKAREIAGFFTNTTATLLGGESITETHISTLTDAILLLRYVEVRGEMLRGVTAIKMRGSWHDKSIYAYEVSAQGMEIREPFRGVESIMTGAPRNIVELEQAELKELL
jgi:circadian clock protein KaiC